MFDDIKKIFGNRPVEIHETIQSTNIRAKELAKKGAESGTVVLAQNQTGGYGQKNRNFYCENGAGLYMSIILRPKISAEESIKLTAFAAVAAAEAIESLVPCEVKIKWVNDLYLNGRKICGILTEGAVDPLSERLEYAVVGIGINTGKIEFPPELVNIATSLYNETGNDISVCALADRIIKKLENADEGYMQEYRRRSCVIGKRVMVKSGDNEFLAEITDIDMNGYLTAVSDGRFFSVNSGEVIME